MEQFQIPEADHHNRGRRGRDQPRFQRGSQGWFLVRIEFLNTYLMPIAIDLASAFGAHRDT